MKRLVAEACIVLAWLLAAFGLATGRTELFASAVAGGGAILTVYGVLTGLLRSTDRQAKKDPPYGRGGSGSLTHSAGSEAGRGMRWQR